MMTTTAATVLTVFVLLGVGLINGCLAESPTKPQLFSFTAEVCLHYQLFSAITITCTFFQVSLIYPGQQPYRDIYWHSQV